MVETTALIETLDADPMKVAELLWSLCESQAEKREVTPEQFAAALDGDTIVKAVEAFIAAVIDFFPRRRVLLTKAMARFRMLEQRATKSLGEAIEAGKLDGPIDQALQKLTSGDAFSGQPASPVSSPGGSVSVT